MNPQDDFLLPTPVRREGVTSLRIALMALAGCLILMAALVIRAHADTKVLPHHPAGATRPAPTEPAPLAPPNLIAESPVRPV